MTEFNSLLLVSLAIIGVIIIFAMITARETRETQCWNYGWFAGKENNIFCAAYPNTNFGNGGEFVYIGDSLDWKQEYDCKVIDGWHIAYGCKNGRR